MDQERNMGAGVGASYPDTVSGCNYILASTNQANY